MGCPTGWVGYFVPLSALSEGELLSLRWFPIVLLQADLDLEMHYSWDGTHSIERGEKEGSWSGKSHRHAISSWLTVQPPLANMNGTQTRSGS